MKQPSIYQLGHTYLFILIFQYVLFHSGVGLDSFRFPISDFRIVVTPFPALTLIIHVRAPEWSPKDSLMKVKQ